MDIVRYLINNAEESGVTPRMVFFGGEPLTEWDSLIVPIVKFIRDDYKKPFILSMTTNGVLLTEDKVRFMHDHALESLYSIDGGKETMAVNRPFCGGDNPSDTIEANLKTVLEYNPNATARITLYQPTAGNFCADILHVQSLGFKRISVLPNLFDDWSDESIEAFRAQVEAYGEHLIAEFRAGRVPPVYEQYVRSFLNILMENKCVAEGYYQTRRACMGSGKCGFGLRGFATTDYQGNIYGCLHQEKLSPSSVFYLGDIYNGIDPSRTAALVDRCDEAPLGGQDCKNCKLSYTCDRGCVPNNYLYSGEFNVPPPMYCHYYRILLDDAIRVCSVLGNEENELFREFFSKCVKDCNRGC